MAPSRSPALTSVGVRCLVLPCLLALCLPACQEAEHAPASPGPAQRAGALSCDPSQCDDGNPCTVHYCHATHGCVTRFDNRRRCDDGDACTLPGMCHFGACTKGPDKVCSDGDVCTTDACEAHAGCTFTPIACSDANPCTEDVCDAWLGCFFLPANGQPCDDADACTTADFCAGFTCFGGPPDPCDDGNPCTDQTCDDSSGCAFAARADGTACADGDACTTGTTCAEALCAGGAAVSCDDDNPCTSDGCDAEAGCWHTPLEDGAPCDSGDPCDGIGACLEGACAGPVPVDCDDANPCTTDACSPEVGCVHTPRADGSPCDDGDACTSGTTCEAASCGGGQHVECEAPGLCALAGQCDSATGACVYPPSPDGQPCDDGDPCTAPGACHAGACAAAPLCDPFATCTPGDPAPSCECPPYAPDLHGDGSACGWPTSCMALFWQGPAWPDGVYVIDPDGPGGSPPYPAYCDHTRAGGGWTLLYTSSDDGQHTFTWEQRALLSTDTTTVGAPDEPHRDFKSAALHDLPFERLLVVHQPSGVWAEYAVDSQGQSFGELVDSIAFPHCPTAAGTGYEMVAGTLAPPPGSPGLCETDLYFNLGDHDGGGVRPWVCQDLSYVWNNATYGPVWNSRRNDGCHFDDPDQVGTGPAYPCINCDAQTAYLERNERGFGGHLGLNTGAPGQAQNFIQFYAKPLVPCLGNDVPDCDDGDPCTADTCVPGVGCAHEPLGDGTACDDGDLCTSGTVCAAGLCGGGASTPCPGPPDDCHLAGICQPETGACVFPPAPDGGACEDGDPCTLAGVCDAGACLAPPVCDPFEVCVPDPGGVSCECPDYAPNSAGDGTCDWPQSCLGVYVHGITWPDGVYAIDPDGPGGAPPYPAYCDHGHSEGGWTLLYTSSDDGLHTFTWNQRTLLSTDTTLVGSPQAPHRDYKGPALHELPFDRLLVLHQPSGVWAEYDVDSQGLSFGELMASISFPQCPSAANTGRKMVAGTLTAPPITPGLCETDLYFHLGDHDGGGIRVSVCQNLSQQWNNATFGPVWNSRNNGGCHFDDPSLVGTGPSYPCLACAADTASVEGGGRGFGGFLGLNTGAPGQAENYIQVYAKQRTVCLGTNPPQCGDGDACTEDTCVPGVGCQHPPVAAGTPCDDGDPCTTDDACGPDGCAGVSVCGDPGPCELPPQCDPTTLACTFPMAPDGAPCGDGDHCQSGECVAGPPPSQTYAGSGADGDLWVDASRVATQQALAPGRTAPDAEARAVLALGAQSVTLASPASGIAAGDEVLLINHHAPAGAHGAVGAYAFVFVASVDGSTLHLTAPLTVQLGHTSNADLAGQSIQAVRVPHYRDVTVTASGRLRPHAWDGSTGGVLALRASGALSVAAGGRIDADAAGYLGGQLGATSHDAFQGHSFAGAPVGGAPSGTPSYNESNGAWAANFGGGGAHITGGGGDHAGGAQAGHSWNGSATPPAAGHVYGQADLGRLFFGSGGGGVFHSGPGVGPGGRGGGVLFVAAQSVSLDGATGMAARGQSTTAWGSGTWTYGAGGGAGGSVWLAAGALTATAGALSAVGGLGQQSFTRHGGHGGLGRIRLDFGSLGGEPWGTPAAEAQASLVTSPAAGWSEAAP